jgi:hypothetical protein
MRALKYKPQKTKGNEGRKVPLSGMGKQHFLKVRK